MDKIEYGSYGESRAVKYLEDKNFEILEQNFRCKIGEIDIIAKDKG
jgi:putative endonuclease